MINPSTTTTSLKRMTESVIGPSVTVITQSKSHPRLYSYSKSFILEVELAHQSDAEYRGCVGEDGGDNAVVLADVGRTAYPQVEKKTDEGKAQWIKSDSTVWFDGR
jgi:hypothetical protein